MDLGVNRYMQDYVPRVLIAEANDESDPRENEEYFRKAMLLERNGLKQLECYEDTTPDQLQDSVKISTSRLILMLKHADTEKAKAKARIVAQRHKYVEKPYTIHDSVALKHSSLRIILSFTIINQYILWPQDLDQAYVQSDIPLQRPINIVPSKPLRLDLTFFWKFLKLYGVCQSVDLWYRSFQNRIINDLLL